MLQRMMQKSKKIPRNLLFSRIPSFPHFSTFEKNQRKNRIGEKRVINNTDHKNIKQYSSLLLCAVENMEKLFKG